MKNTLLCICLFAIISCSDSKPKDSSRNTDMELISELLYPVLDSLIPKDTKGRDYVYFENFKNDSIKYWSLERYLSIKTDETQKVALVNELFQIMEEDPVIELNHNDSYRFSIVYREKSIDSLLSYSLERCIGLFNLSKISYNESRDLACFYIAPQFGDLGGGTYIVFIQKEESVWSIDEIFTAFVGE